MRNRPKKDFKKDDKRSDKPFKKDRGNERKGSAYDPFKKKHFEKRDDRDDFKKDRADKSGKDNTSFAKKPFHKEKRDDRSFKKKEFDQGEGKNRGDFRGNDHRKFKRKGRDYKSFSKKSLRKDEMSEKAESNADGKIRLNKYISNAGICSRREADQFIASGVVKVNGEVVTELGYKINPGDLVQFDGQRLTEERKVYLLLNKPKDYITTADDPEGRKTVLDLVKGACKERVYPVGRLDRNTSGLLVLTNDGDLTKKLTHPKFGIKKIYHVTLDKNIKQEDIDKLVEGVELEDGKSHFDTIYFLGQAHTKNQLVVELHSGKNRIIRRMFEHLGYEVVGLDRTQFAGLTKKDLPRGRWRYLDEKEIGMLKMRS